MLRKLHFDFGDMALALVLWMCSLPLVGLLVVPFFGLKIGAIVAVVLFFVAMAVWASKLASAFAVGKFSKLIFRRIRYENERR